MIKKMWSWCVLAVLLLALNLTSSAATVTPGVWCTDLNAAKNYAQANKMPLFCFYGVDGCTYCEKAITAFNTSTFKNYMAKKKIVYLWLHPHDWSDDAAWKFASNNWKADLFPAMRVWWPGVKDYTFVGRLSHHSVKSFAGAQLQDKLISIIDTYTNGWSPANPTSTFAFNTTSQEMKEGSTRQFSVTRTGGKKAMSATLTIDANSGITFDDGSLKKTLSWAANQTGAKTFTVKAPYDAKIGSTIRGSVSMSITASTKEDPTVLKTPTLTLAVTDEFVTDASWVSDVELASGDWEIPEDGENILSVNLAPTEDEEATARIRIQAAKSGILDVSGVSGDPTTVALSVENKGGACVLSTDYECEGAKTVFLAKNDWLDIIATGKGLARVKDLAFIPGEAPVVTNPKSGSSLSQDAVKANKALATLSWNAVAGANYYEIKSGDYSETIQVDPTSVQPLSVNLVDVGAITLGQVSDKTYTWSVTAVRDEGYDAGEPLKMTATGAFTLTVQPIFNLSLSSATIYLKAGATISAAASGAPNITYSASGLPAGLALNAKTGVIAGTPKKAGSYKVKVTAKSSNGHASSKTITVTVAKFPKATLKAKYFGYTVNAAGVGTAGYEASVSATGKVSGKRLTATGAAKIKGSVSVDYTTGAQRIRMALDGKAWNWNGAGFTSGTSVLCKQAANGALTGYSNVAVADGNGKSRGYLAVKVSSGKKAKVTGVVNGKKISKSVSLAVAGGTGRAFFGQKGISGLVVVTAAGVGEMKVADGGAVYPARGTKFASSLAAASLAGYKLWVNGVALPLEINAKMNKIGVAKTNSYGAKLSWKKKVGTFSGKFNGQKFTGAFVKDGVWVGAGSTVGGYLPVSIVK